MSGKDKYTDSAPPLGFDQAWVDDNLKNGEGADLMTAQILKQGLYDKWTGQGFGTVYNNARSIADRLSAAGIQRLEDFGRREKFEKADIGYYTVDGKRSENDLVYEPASDGEGGTYFYGRPITQDERNRLTPVYGTYAADSEGYSYFQPQSNVQIKDGVPMYPTGGYEFYNKATGQKVGGDQQSKNVLDITYAGDGSTRMGVEFNELGMPMFFTQYNGSSSDWGSIAPLLSIASFIPGVAPFAMAVNAIGSAYNGNYVGAILSAIGSANAFGAEFSTINPSAANAVNGMDAASDAAIGASSIVTSSANWIAQNAGNIKTAQQAVGLLNALDKRNVAGIISGLVDIAPQVGVTVPADIVKPINVAAMASAASKGDWAGALNAAKLITDNPTLRQDLNLASKAANMVGAINSGNPAAMMSSFMGLAKDQNLGAGTVQQTARQLGMPMSASTADKLMSYSDPDQHVKDYYAQVQSAQDSAVAKTGKQLPDSFFLDYAGDVGKLKSAADDFFLASLPVEVPGVSDLEKILNFDKGTQTASSDAGSSSVGAATSWVPPLASDEKIVGTKTRSDGARSAVIERTNPNDPSQKYSYEAVLDPDTGQVFYEYGGGNTDAMEVVASQSKPSWSWTDEKNGSVVPSEPPPEVPEIPIDSLTGQKVPGVEDIIKDLKLDAPSTPSTPSTTPTGQATSGSPTTASVSPDEVEKIVSDAIKANPILKPEDVRKIVSDAVSTIPNLTADQVKNIVNTEVSTKTADVETRLTNLYNNLSNDQKNLADQLTKQGVDLSAAIDIAKQQTQKQIIDLNDSLNQRVDELMKQGLDQYTATQKAILEVTQQNQQLQNLVGTRGRGAAQSDIDALSEMLSGKRGVDLAYDANGDGKITQADLDFLGSIVSGGGSGWTPGAGTVWGGTGLYGDIAAAEAKRQADLAAAEQQRQADIQAQIAREKEAARLSAIRTAAGTAQTQLGQLMQAAPGAYKALQQTTTPIYAGEMQDFSLSSPLDVGFFDVRKEAQGGQKQQQTTKIATGGYLDDLLDLLR
jgi:hypothetical protein